MSVVTIQQLIDAALDCDHIEDLATSTSLTATDRLGRSKYTMQGALAALGYQVPVAYAAGISLTAGTQTVEYSGSLYAPLIAELPFTTSGTFEAAKFRPIQTSGAVISVESIGDLLSFPWQRDDQSVSVAGYYPGTIVGGSTFVWDASRLKSEHNGGTIISPTVPWDGTTSGLSAFLAGTGETNPAGSGCWVRLLAGFVTPQMFGAVADGVEICTAAINYCLASGAQSVYFPDGTYLIDGALVPAAGQRIYGNGRASHILVADGANLPVSIFSCGDTSSKSFRIHIDKILIDGNRDNQTSGTQHGIHIYNPLYCTLNEVTVERVRGSGFYLQGNSVPDAFSFENYLIHCRAYRCGNAGAFFSGATTDNHIRDGNYGANDLIGVYMGSPSSSIKGATIWGGGITQQGVVIDSASVQLQENEIEGFLHHTVIVTSYADSVFIAGNKIYAGALSADTAGSYDGIYIEANADSGAIIGNKIYSALGGSTYLMRYAVNFAGAHSVWTIRGNEFRYLGSGVERAGAVCNGILSTDDTDQSWIATDVVASLGSDIAAPAVSTWTHLMLTVENKDRAGEYNAAASIFQPVESGLYRIEISTLFNADASSRSYGLSVYKNGVEARRVGMATSGASGLHMSAGTCDMWLTAADQITIRYFVSGGTTIIAGAAYTLMRITGV